jgi:hypothetical protein
VPQAPPAMGPSTAGRELRPAACHAFRPAACRMLRRPPAARSDRMPATHSASSTRLPAASSAALVCVVATRELELPQRIQTHRQRRGRDGERQKGRRERREENRSGAACCELRRPHVRGRDSRARAPTADPDSETEERERQRETDMETREERGESKWSGSVPPILRDGANLHIGGIFSGERLRSRRSPSKQPRSSNSEAMAPNRITRSSGSLLYS